MSKCKCPCCSARAALKAKKRATKKRGLHLSTKSYQPSVVYERPLDMVAGENCGSYMADGNPMV